jgi:O-antigen biosynthesis protein
VSAPPTTITVVISTRNRAPALDRCLRSLAAGECRPDDIVVVDQGDDDSAADVVVQHRHAGLPIAFVRHGGRGLGASQNAGFAHARNDIVAVIDDDCVAHERWMSEIESAMAQRPDLDGVTGRVVPLEPVGERTFAVSSRTSDVRREFVGQALPWEVGSGNNFALRREAFARVGGCDERLGPGSPARGGVDMDLFHRLVRAGSRIAYEPSVIVYHERQTRAERRARRPMYGRGMGTAIALWHRNGDTTARRVLAAWVRLRFRQMRLALARGDWRDVGDELTMLASTVSGLAHGYGLTERR